MAKNKFKVETASRSVIENKLLVSLRDNKDKIAILANKDDCEIIYSALKSAKFLGKNKEIAEELIEGLHILIRDAF